jgi:hypothetical protein
MKPSMLKQSESAAWRALLRIGKGSPVETEVPQLIQELRDMFEEWKKQGIDPVDLGFFDFRTFSISYSSQNCILTHAISICSCAR